MIKTWISVEILIFIVEKYVERNLPFLKLEEKKIGPMGRHLVYKMDIIHVLCAVDRGYFYIDIFKFEEGESNYSYIGSKPISTISSVCHSKLNLIDDHNPTTFVEWIKCLLEHLSAFFEKEILDYEKSNPDFEIISFDKVYKEVLSEDELEKMNAAKNRKPWWRKLLDLY